MMAAARNRDIQAAAREDCARLRGIMTL